jgi:hypothetical protein
MNPKFQDTARSQLRVILKLCQEMDVGFVTEEGNAVNGLSFHLKNAVGFFDFVF